MTKREIASILAKEKQLSVMEATNIIDTLLDILKNAIKRKQSIFLRGFGTFAIKKQGQKIGQDIRLRQPITIAARTKVKFIPSKDLKILK